tara:strand:- start:104 stop:313 length:210 start_codon:yes stop_codon:yes gene_type:complete
MKNYFLYLSLSTLGVLALSSGITSSLYKSTFIDCRNDPRIENKACKQLLHSGNNFQIKQAKKILFLGSL